MDSLSSVAGFPSHGWKLTTPRSLRGLLLSLFSSSPSFLCKLKAFSFAFLSLWAGLCHSSRTADGLGVGFGVYHGRVWAEHILYCIRVHKTALPSASSCCTSANDWTQFWSEDWYWAGKVGIQPTMSYHISKFRQLQLPWNRSSLC